MQAKVRYTCLGVLLLAALAASPFRLVVISGQSMQPTLRNGERYLMDQVYWRVSGLRRDDIVVVRHGQERWVKRLIGMPGDTLQLTYRGRGWITNVANLTVNPSLRVEAPNRRLRKVGADEIFIIGDNLNWSADSTNQEAGAFRLQDVLGIVRSFTLQRSFPFRTPATPDPT